MASEPSAKEVREGSFGFLIQTLARRLDASMRERLQAIGVDLKTFANLMLLSEEDGINQRQLGAKLDFPEYYTSRSIDALVAAGYAERRADPESRRSYLIFLTEAGRAKAAELPAIVREVNEHYLSGLEPADRRQLVLMLRKVAGIRLIS